MFQIQGFDKDKMFTTSMMSSKATKNMKFDQDSKELTGHEPKHTRIWNSYFNTGHSKLTERNCLKT